jgi:hypothetical protein
MRPVNEIVAELERVTGDHPWAAALVKKGPCEHPEGCNPWLFEASKAFLYFRRRHQLSDEEIMRVLREGADTYTRNVPDREVLHCFESAKRQFEKSGGIDDLKPTAPRTIKPNLNRIDNIVRRCGSIDTLRNESPGNLNASTDEIVSALFEPPPGEPESWICAGLERNEATARTLSSWVNHDGWSDGYPTALNQYAFIVPNPLMGPWAINNEGRSSARCNNNIATRKYLIIECDITAYKGPIPTPWKPLIDKWDKVGITIHDACAAILLHLCEYQPLVLVVNSAGKSLHGWFACHGREETELREFFEYARLLGADPPMWTPCQYTRMPGGRRWQSKGELQQVEYFNPEMIREMREVSDEPKA